MKSPLDLARANTHKQHDDLRRALWRAIYLTEIQGHFELSDIAADCLRRSRAEILNAIGLTPTP